MIKNVMSMWFPVGLAGPSGARVPSAIRHTMTERATRKPPAAPPQGGIRLNS